MLPIKKNADLRRLHTGLTFHLNMTYGFVLFTEVKSLNTNTGTFSLTTI